MLAQIREELDIPRSPPSRREIAGIGSRHLCLIKPRKCGFYSIFRQSCGESRGSRAPGKLFLALQSTAAYKYPVIGPERELNRKQRAEYFHCLCYSGCSSLASLQI